MNAFSEQIYETKTWLIFVISGEFVVCPDARNYRFYHKNWALIWD